MPVSTEDGAPAMLKLAHHHEEERATDLLVALDGHGAARVLRRDGAAMLLERATGPRDLVEMVREAATGRGRPASSARSAGSCTPRRSACSACPHRRSSSTSRTWFRQLFAHADGLGPLHRAGASVARRLLDEPGDPVILHGDLHHANVLDFGERGWLAIDPKGLVGDAEFDVCNVLCNPHERARAGPAGAAVRGRGGGDGLRAAPAPRLAGRLVRALVDVVRARRRPRARGDGRADRRAPARGLDGSTDRC